jgi:hypothetical protein
MQTLLNELKTPSAKLGTRVRMPWTAITGGPGWNDPYAWAVENFGVQGENFHTNCSVHYMDFYFYDERNAIYFALRWL